MARGGQQNTSVSVSRGGLSARQSVLPREIRLAPEAHSLGYRQILQWSLSQLPKLQAGDTYALSTYSGPFAYLFNQRLREEPLQDGKVMISQYHSTAEALDRAFQSVDGLPTAVMVQRKLRSNKMESLWGASMDDLGSLVGTTQTEKAYSSTSMRRFWSREEDIDMHIRIPAGTPAILMDSINQSEFDGVLHTDTIGSPSFHEHELLLPRGARYKILSVGKGVHGQTLIECEVVGFSQDPLAESGELDKLDQAANSLEGDGYGGALPLTSSYGLARREEARNDSSWLGITKTKL